MQMNILDAKNRLSKIIKSVQAGEEVVIANRGEPVAKLVPVRGATARPEQGTAQAILGWLDRNPLPDYARRSAREIDASIKEARGSWD